MYRLQSTLQKCAFHHYGVTNVLQLVPNKGRSLIHPMHLCTQQCLTLSFPRTLSLEPNPLMALFVMDECRNVSQKTLSHLVFQITPQKTKHFYFCLFFHQSQFFLDFYHYYCCNVNQFNLRLPCSSVNKTNPSAPWS